MGGPAVPQPPDTYLEQYKTYVGDLANIGNRHADATKYYVSLITAVLVFPPLLASAGQSRLLALGVPLLGLGLSVLWGLTAYSYNQLYAAKFKIIGVLEAKLAYACYAEEKKLLDAGGYLQLTMLEKFASAAMGLLFIVVLTMRLKQYL